MRSQSASWAHVWLRVRRVRLRAERRLAKMGDDEADGAGENEERGEGQPELTVGQQVKATVRRMLNFGAFCALEGGYEVLLPASEMGLNEEEDEDMEDKFEEGQTLEARVISINGPQVRYPLTPLAQLVEALLSG